jgi:hypothetical protein
MKQSLKDYILTIPNVLPADEYYEVLDYCEQTNDFQRQSVVPPNGLRPGKVNKYGEDTFHQRGERFDIKLHDGRIHDLIRKSFIFGLNESLKQYDYLIPKMYNLVSGYWLLKYSEGDFLTMHTDFQAEAGSITMTYNINENYKGGELVFWDEYVLPNQKNTIHAFPSCFLYPHEIKPIQQGNRYAAITWFGYETGDRPI